jgi:uncharacterized protein (TIGR00255 family)
MALSGMTGFAREEGAYGAWSWAVEARSVNGRNLEARFRGPPGFDGLERAARDGAQTRFQRGQITIGLQAKRLEAEGQVRINTGLLDRYLELSATLVAEGQATTPTADGLLSLRGVIEQSEEADDVEVRAAVEAAMARSIEAVLDGLKTSRLAEGTALTPVLNGAVDRIAVLVAQGESEAAAQPAYVRGRFERRMTELLAERTASLDERIVQEAAVLAGKADVREELDRLTAHIAAARALLRARPRLAAGWTS